MEPTIKKWLNSRGISNAVIKSSGLEYQNRQIIIPIRDSNGDFIFNKMRRDPQESDGPKYTYENGAESSLYNVHTIKNLTDEIIFICEGELDALVLNSLGQYAVTSTGGSGTFKKEWGEYFKDKENVFIIFDQDDAGYKGAIKAQRIVPHAKIIFLPTYMQGSDITDYFQEFTMKDFFKLEARTYPIPKEPSGELDKQKLKETINEFKNACDELLEIKRENSFEKKDIRPIFLMLAYVTSRYESYNEMLKRFDKRQNYHGGSNDIEAAKQVPISQYIQFNYNGFAKCIWHKEKTGSMKYNKPGTKYNNTVKCFGCGQMGDTIDVVMEQRGVNFKEAVKIILNK